MFPCTHSHHVHAYHLQVSAIPWLPGTIFGVGCLIIAGLVMLLPESQGRELPETVDEIQAWPKDPSASIPTT